MVQSLEHVRVQCESSVHLGLNHWKLNNRQWCTSPLIWLKLMIDYHTSRMCFIITARTTGLTTKIFFHLILKEMYISLVTFYFISLLWVHILQILLFYRKDIFPLLLWSTTIKPCSLILHTDLHCISSQKFWFAQENNKKRGRKKDDGMRSTPKGFTRITSRSPDCYSHKKQELT